MLISVNAVQPEKAYSPISGSPHNVADVKLVHPSNEWLPTHFVSFGTLTDSSAVHPLNAESPISSTSAPKSISSNVVQF